MDCDCIDCDDLTCTDCKVCEVYYREMWEAHRLEFES